MTHAAAPQLVRDDHALAFHRVRVALGVLGMALPLLLALAGRLVDGHVQPSISDFFHTSARDVFVGGLSAIAIFMITHRGLGGGRTKHHRRGNIFAVLAGLSALGVALIPNEAEVVTTLSQEILGLKLSPALHYGAATMFYLMMSLTCLLVYARTTTGAEALFHRIMGWTVWCSGWAVMLLTYWKRSGSPALQNFTIENNLIFWDESLGVWAFCASWLVQAHCEYKRAQRRATAQGHGRGARPNLGAHTPPAGPRGPRPGSALPDGVVTLVQSFGSALGGAYRSDHAPLAPMTKAPPILPDAPLGLSRHHHRASTTVRGPAAGTRPSRVSAEQRRG